MSINDRYQNVLVLAEDRHSRLKEAITLHQFFRDIADEESWIKEKKLLVGSDDYGRDLTGVQNLKKKHKRLESELASHQPTINSVQEAGQHLISVSQFGGQEIEGRTSTLVAGEQERQSSRAGALLHRSIGVEQRAASPGRGVHGNHGYS